MRRRHPSTADLAWHLLTCSILPPLRWHLVTCNILYRQICDGTFSPAVFYRLCDGTLSPAIFCTARFAMAPSHLESFLPPDLRWHLLTLKMFFAGRFAMAPSHLENIFSPADLRHLQNCFSCALTFAFLSPRAHLIPSLGGKAAVVERLHPEPQTSLLPSGAFRFLWLQCSWQGNRTRGGIYLILVRLCLFFFSMLGYVPRAVRPSVS